MFLELIVRECVYIDSPQHYRKGTVNLTIKRNPRANTGVSNGSSARQSV